MKIIYPVSRGESNATEHNDCTVRALCNAANWKYPEAHAMLSKHGRRFRRGAVFSVYYKAYVEAGAKLIGVYGNTRRAVAAGRIANTQQQAGITLNSLMPRLRSGRYIVLITGHALAVVDGKVIDAGGVRAGSHVFALFKI
jgi:hypothetical protein